MAKLTIEALDKKHAAIGAARAELDAEKKRAEQEQKDLAEQAEAAARAGNVERYVGLKKQAADAESASYVYTAHLKEQLVPISEDEAREAWDNYRKEYETEFSRKLEAFQQLKASMLTAYKNLIDAQSGAFEIRERLGGYLGMRVGDLQDRDRIKAIFPVAVIPAVSGVNAPLLNGSGMGFNDRDLAFAISNLSNDNTQIFNSPEARRYIAVVKNHTSR